MTDVLIAAIILCVIAYFAYKYMPQPIGLIIAVVAGLILLIKYLLPLL